MIASFQILCNLSLTDHPTRDAIVRYTDSIVSKPHTVSQRPLLTNRLRSTELTGSHTPRSNDEDKTSHSICTRKLCFFYLHFVCYSSVIPKVCSAHLTGSATSSQGIRGYISVMATLKFTYILN